MVSEHETHREMDRGMAGLREAEKDCKLGVKMPRGKTGGVGGLTGQIRKMDTQKHLWIYMAC